MKIPTLIVSISWVSFKEVGEMSREGFLALQDLYCFPLFNFRNEKDTKIVSSTVDVCSVVFSYGL